MPVCLVYLSLWFYNFPIQCCWNMRSVLEIGLSFNAPKKRRSRGRLGGKSGNGDREKLSVIA